MVNELYLALVYRPAAGAAPGWSTRVLARAQRPRLRRWSCADALDACEKLAQTVRPRSSATSRSCWVPIAQAALVLLAARVSSRCWSMASRGACRCRGSAE